MKKVIIISTVLIFVLAPTASAVLLGQIDDFQDGTTQNWGSGVNHPVPPVNSADNGPLGIGDHCLLAATTGTVGAGGKMVFFNSAQWAGDYTAAGVTKIAMMLNNLGGQDLTMRLAFDGGGGMFSTMDEVTLTAGSGWQSVEFSVAAADLVSVGGASVAGTLSNVTVLRVLNSDVPSWVGSDVTAELFVDNITAVPEPATLFVLGLGSLLLKRRTR